MLKRKLDVLFPGILILLIFASVISAQSLELNWETTWNLALAQNESLAMAKDEAVKARHMVNEAKSGAYPAINFDAVFMHYYEIPATILNLPAEMNIDPNTNQSRGPLRIKTTMGSANNVSANLQLIQPLYAAGKIGIALEIAKVYEELTRLGISVSEQDLKLAVTGAFYGVILAKEFLEVSREALEIAENHLKQVEALYDEGLVSEYDLIRAKVAVSNLKPQLVQAETGLELTEKGLKNLIGMDLDTEINVSGNLEMNNTPPQDYNDACKIALDKRIEFKQLELQKEMYKGQYKIENRSWLWPNLMVGLSWETMAQSDNTEFSKYEFLGGYGANLILQVPLFDGFKSHHKAQQAKIEMRNIERQKTQLKRGTSIQVFQAISDYEKSQKELNAALEALEQAIKGHSISKVRYSQGVGTQLEILDAQLQVNSSKVNILQAKFNQKIAYANYERAIGISELKHN